MTSISVDKLYKAVINEVVESMKEAVLDEGIDEQVLAELKQLWEAKLAATKATEGKAMPTHYPIPASTSMPRSKPSGAGPSTQAAAAVAIHAPQPVAMGATQVYRPAPVRPHQTQPLDMSGAAATATMALPQMYQQQLLAGGIQLQQTSTGITAVIPANALQSGNLNIQQVHQPQQQVQPQNLSTKVQGQLDGAIDSTQESSSEDNQSAQCTSSGSQLSQDLSCRPKTTVRPKLTRCRRKPPKEIEVVIQLDGADTSSDDDVDIDDDDDDVDNDDLEGEGEEEPLNSGDDDEDDDQSAAMFDMENVVVCQYDKITRSKNRWRFTLKDGIMSINQRDYVFHKAHGEAEW